MNSKNKTPFNTWNTNPLKLSCNEAQALHCMHTKIRTKPRKYKRT